MLSTLPGVTEFHSVVAWCICSAIWVTISFAAAVLFFYSVLQQTNAFIPALAFLLYGVALGITISFIRIYFMKMKLRSYGDVHREIDTKC